LAIFYGYLGIKAGRRRLKKAGNCFLLNLRQYFFMGSYIPKKPEEGTEGNDDSVVSIAATNASSTCADKDRCSPTHDDRDP